MPFYVFALVDARPSARAGRGFAAAVSVRPVAGGFAAVERRADVPPLEFGSLRAHERTVDRLASLVPAILPVRFGTLVDEDELDTILGDRDDDIADAFDLVRGRVQFTWRSAVRGRAASPPRAKSAARSGADYLRRAARAANPAPPPSFRRVTSLARLAVQERFAAAAPPLTGALYHLVERERADAYAAAATSLRAGTPALAWSGPFAPYAFVPELL